MTNETVNYDTKTKAYVLILAEELLRRAVQVKEFQKQSFADLKLRVIKNFVNSTSF